MLEIPSDIYSHTKHLWDEIQSKLQNDTDDNTPFAMLPVRLETRFMKVKRKWTPYIQSHSTLEVWNNVNVSIDTFDTIAGHNYADATKEINAYESVSARVSDTIDKVNNDTASYSMAAKLAINETADFLKTAIDLKIANTQTNQNLSSSERSQLVANLTAINQQCNTLKSAVDAKTESGNSQFNGSVDLSAEIAEMNTGKTTLSTQLPAYNNEIVVPTYPHTAPNFEVFDDVINRIRGFEQIDNPTEVLPDLRVIQQDVITLKRLIWPLLDYDNEWLQNFQNKLLSYLNSYNNFQSRIDSFGMESWETFDEIQRRKYQVSRAIEEIERYIYGNFEIFEEILLEHISNAVNSGMTDRYEVQDTLMNIQADLRTVKGMMLNYREFDGYWQGEFQSMISQYKDDYYGFLARLDALGMEAWENYSYINRVIQDLNSTIDEINLYLQRDDSIYENIILNRIIANKQSLSANRDDVWEVLTSIEVDLGTISSMVTDYGFDRDISEFRGEINNCFSIIHGYTPESSLEGEDWDRTMNNINNAGDRVDALKAGAPITATVPNVQSSQMLSELSSLVSTAQSMASSLSQITSVDVINEQIVNTIWSDYNASVQTFISKSGNVPLTSEETSTYNQSIASLNAATSSITSDINGWTIEADVPVADMGETPLWSSPVYDAGNEEGGIRTSLFSQYRIVDELWVRIFPDDIHIHTHENPLTLDEIEAGENYWWAWWESEGDMEIREGAWKALCELYGPQRAAWIINQMTPDNMPVEPVDDDSLINMTADVFTNGTNAVQGTVTSDTYDGQGVADAANAFLGMTEDLIAQTEGAGFSSESKGNIIKAFDEFAIEVSAYNELQQQAAGSGVQINRGELISIDMDSQFRSLEDNLLMFRDGNPEIQFNANEWIGSFGSESESIGSLRGQVESGIVDLDSLIGASRKTSILLGHIKANEDVLRGLENEPSEDPLYTLAVNRVGQSAGQMMNTMENLKYDLEGLEVSVKTGIQNFKFSDMNADAAGPQLIATLYNAFGQIKQNVQNSPEPDPWNPFDHLPDEDPDFPSPNTKEGAWTQAPKTFMLPDRFVAIGLDESVKTGTNDPEYGTNTYTFKQIEVGELVPPELHIGIDPTLDEDGVYEQTADGGLVVDDNMKWMVDFNDAVEKGMGIIMRLQNALPDEGENVFDKLVVMGVKLDTERFHKPDETKDYSSVSLKDYSKELLEELLINHHYKEDGMGIVSIGTATNNTENGASGWQVDDTHYEDSFAFEALNKLFPIRSSHLEQRNGQRLAEALGVDYNIFQHIQNADSKEIGDGFKFNKMMWHGTIGNYLQEMLSGLVSRSNYEKAKAYFDKYVSARGVLPSLRVGAQPYGILPATSFTKWSFGVDIAEQYMKHPGKLYENTLHDAAGDPSYNYAYMNKYKKPFIDKRFDAGFMEMMQLLQNRWYGLFNQTGMVKHVGGLSGTDDFMEALGLHATTAEIKLRHPYSIVDLFNGSDPKFQNSFGTVSPSDFFGLKYLGDHQKWTELVKNGLFHEQSMAFSEDNIVNHIQYLNSNFSVVRNTIDKYKISENWGINKSNPDNYLEWIRMADLRYIWDPTEPGANNPFPSNPPLLYKLLRQSYLMMHLDAFVDVSVQSGLMDPNMYHTLSNETDILSSMITTSGGNVGGTEDRLSKWAFLLEKISDFAGSTGTLAHLADYKTGLDQYLTDKNITLNTGNYTFAQHVQSYYSNFWKFKGGYPVRNRIAQMDKIYQEAQTWSTAHIDRLFKENLDLGSYRLDAWMNGFVNRRLERTRRSYSGSSIKFIDNGSRSREKGIYVGAYGWLENVKPGGARTAIDSADGLPASLEIANTTIFKDDDNLGFIHGPSVYHAMTAAILRSGYASNEDVLSPYDNPMAINLSSERARMGKHLWEGIKNGQSLGALLGYQFERNLHELYNDNAAWELDKYIYQFREKYPIEDYHNDTNMQAESVPAQNVVNGVNLLADIRGYMKTENSALSLKDYVIANITNVSKDFHITITDPDLTNIKAVLAREIDLMANAIDALGDLAIAEGVFQLSRGNFDRASTTIDTLIDNPNLPLPEILDTPRTGHQVTHRMAVNMDLGINPGTGAVINPWTGVTLTGKANAAPHINQFIAKYLPAPADIRCLVKYVDSDEFERTEEVSIADLGWQPIDLYTTLLKTINNKQSDELLTRIAVHARESLEYGGTAGVGGAAPIPQIVELTILVNESGASWSTSVYTITEILPIIEHLSKVLAEIDPVKIQDFSLPQDTSEDDEYGWDLTDLNNRVDTVLSALDTFRTTTPSDYQDALIEAGIYSVTQTVLDTDVAADLENQWDNVVKPQLDVLAANALAIFNNPDPDIPSIMSNTEFSDKQKWEKLLEVVQVVFGTDFTFLPLIDLTTSATNTGLNNYIDTDQNDLMSNVGDTGFEQDTLSQWFYGLSRLKSKLGAFEALSDFDEANDLEFTPLQFPYVKDATAATHDYWYGWEFPESYEPTGNKISVVMTDKTLLEDTIDPATGSQKMVGFMLEQWSEMIPEKKEASGLAFHYDQPNAKPPQNVLLAVTPEFTGSWDGNDILFTLLDTLKMSKVRLVEPEHLQTDEMLGKYLPTTYSLLKLKLSDYSLAMQFIDNTAVSQQA